METSMIFVNFWLNLIQNYSIQIKKMKDGIFSFQMKTKLLLPNIYRRCFKNVPPPLDLTRILKSYHTRNDTRQFPEKKGVDNTM